ncbi:hypothetical protein EVAR_78017_1 [Eumeta japonica]|uniref:Uncharacterized protein n=1 Tax=Eumeta variegata TaxID=151549 RepID=A0A4C1T031_EUMVA|nr:hypothetical protein EVAR_78017_1 [Eumeta japonica]
MLYIFFIVVGHTKLYTNRDIGLGEGVGESTSFSELYFHDEGERQIPVDNRALAYDFVIRKYQCYMHHGYHHFVCVRKYMVTAAHEHSQLQSIHRCIAGHLKGYGLDIIYLVDNNIFLQRVRKELFESVTGQNKKILQKIVGRHNKQVGTYVRAETAAHETIAKRESEIRVNGSATVLIYNRRRRKVRECDHELDVAAMVGIPVDGPTTSWSWSRTAIGQWRHRTVCRENLRRWLMFSDDLKWLKRNDL